MLLKPLSIAFRPTPAVTRLPFQFGITTLERTELWTARVEIEAAGVRALGYSADLLVPKWFEKDPAKSLEQDLMTLKESSKAAAISFLTHGVAPRPLFDLWKAVYDERVGSLPAEAPDRLVRGFGVALIERALMDAMCRCLNVSFFDAWRRDLFGFRPGEIEPSLAAWRPLQSGAPADSVALRHTVGLADALTPGDVRIDPKDGLPRCLAEDIERYGLTHFKLKVAGGSLADRERLIAIARVLRERVEAPFISLDGNEQAESALHFARFLDDMESDADGRWLLEHMAYIEQPLHRDRSFNPDEAEGLAALGQRCGVILDEADHGLEAFPRGVELGYRGVSIKNCKGVFRSLINAARCAGDEQLFQSAEDLTNLPALALQQDLGTVALLGLPDVERNGHHYFPGLSHLSPTEQRVAVGQHPDLYAPHPELGGELRVESGRLQLGSLNTTGYACAAVPPPGTPFGSF